MKSDNSQQLELEKIPAAQTYSVRQEVLRKGKPHLSSKFEGDNDKSTFHLGIFSNEKIAGVATFLKNKSALFEEEVQYQLRGMAVLPAYQHQKLGQKLLLEGEKQLKKEEVPIILWCNARETAKAFYLKHNFIVKGDSFEIKDIGTHFVLYKKIV